VGATAKLGGNIDALASISVSSGTVSGKVTHPSGSTYTGPVPAGGNVTGSPTIPTMPVMPAITSFPNYGDTNITNTRTITPGAYKDVILGSNSTLTLSGPGTYIFKSLTTNGPNSQIAFDFKNTASGNFFIYVYSDVILNKNSAIMKMAEAPHASIRKHTAPVQQIRPTKPQPGIHRTVRAVPVTCLYGMVRFGLLTQQSN